MWPKDFPDLETPAKNRGNLKSAHRPGDDTNIGLANFNAASSKFCQRNTSRATGCMDTLPQNSVLKFRGIRRKHARGFCSLTEAETESSPGFDTRWICTFILSQVGQVIYIFFSNFFVVVAEYCLLNDF